MRKFTLALVALAAIGLTAPYVASAQADTIVIHKHHRHHFLPPPVFHHDHNKTVIIKHDND